MSDIKNKPVWNATRFEAEDVVAEKVETTLVLKEGNFLSYETKWWWDADMPRNLAKSVTVP